MLQEQFESAERALAKLESASEVSAPAPVINNAELKRAKIQLAMRRAELKKASSQAQSSAELALLNDAVTAAELMLSALEQSEA